MGLAWSSVLLKFLLSIGLCFGVTPSTKPLKAGRVPEDVAAILKAGRTIRDIVNRVARENDLSLNEKRQLEKSLKPAMDLRIPENIVVFDTKISFQSNKQNYEIEYFGLDHHFLTLNGKVLALSDLTDLSQISKRIQEKTKDSTAAQNFEMYPMMLLLSKAHASFLSQISTGGWIAIAAIAVFTIAKIMKRNKKARQANAAKATCIALMNEFYGPETPTIGSTPPRLAPPTAEESRQLHGCLSQYGSDPYRDIAPGQLCANGQPRSMVCTADLICCDGFFTARDSCSCGCPAGKTQVAAGYCEGVQPVTTDSATSTTTN